MSLNNRKSNNSRRHKTLKYLRKEKAMIRTCSSRLNKKRINGSLMNSILSLNSSMQSFDCTNNSNHFGYYNPISKETYSDKDKDTESMIASLYSEIEKMKLNSETKVKEIIKLNQIICALETNLFKYQEQTKPNNDKCNDDDDHHHHHIRLNYKTMYEEIRGAFDKEIIEHKKQINELKKKYNHQMMRNKKEKEAITKALKTVLLNSKQLKMDCKIIKQEMEYLWKVNREMCLNIMTEINQKHNINPSTQKPNLHLHNEPVQVKEIAHKRQWKLNEHFHNENITLVDRLSQSVQENKLLAQRLEDIAEENHSLKTIIQGCITKNGLNSINTRKLKEHYERILKEKETKMSEVHFALNESIHSFCNISSINKANELDREVKAIMKQTVY